MLPVVYTLFGHKGTDVQNEKATIHSKLYYSRHRRKKLSYNSVFLDFLFFFFAPPEVNQTHRQADRVPVRACACTVFFLFFFFLTCATCLHWYKQSGLTDSAAYLQSFKNAKGAADL